MIDRTNNISPPGCGLLVLIFWFAIAAPIIGQSPQPPEPDPVKEDLGQRLIRKTISDTDEDLMQAVIRLMDESAKKLEIEFDPGEDTQRVQGGILQRLDEAIQTAAAQTRAKSQSKQKTKSDKRSMPPGEKREPGKAKPQSAEKGGDSPEDSSNKGEAASGNQPAGGELQESRRAWGHLRTRERDELIQGAGEEHLERFRAWIERYYRALQESEEEVP